MPHADADRGGRSSAPETGDGFGASLAATAGNPDRGDFTGIVVGVSGEDVGAIVDAGTAHVFDGLEVIDLTARFNAAMSQRFGAAVG